MNSSEPHHFLSHTGNEDKLYTQQLLFYTQYDYYLGFPGDTVLKNLPANAEDARDMGLIPGLGRVPGEGNGNPLQYYCLENPMDRGAWWATVHGVAR